MSKYFYDTEFIENGNTIDLISIGIVCDDGRELYLQNRECSLHLASNWVKENVFPSLLGFGFGASATSVISGSLGIGVGAGGIVYSLDQELWHDKEYIAQQVKDFIIGDNIELWAYYSAYDHVALCRLFGKMIDLPKNIPMFTNDIMQFKNAFNLHLAELPKQEGILHNALDDAKWVKKCYDYLNNSLKDRLSGMAANSNIQW